MAGGQRGGAEAGEDATEVGEEREVAVKLDGRRSLHQREADLARSVTRAMVKLALNADEEWRIMTQSNRVWCALPERTVVLEGALWLEHEELQSQSNDQSDNKLINQYNQ